MNRSGLLTEGLTPALTYLSFRAAAWLAERLPRRAGDFIGRLAADMWYLLSAKRREVVRRNLFRVAGTLAGSEDSTASAGLPGADRDGSASSLAAQGPSGPRMPGETAFGLAAQRRTGLPIPGGAASGSGAGSIERLVREAFRSYADYWVETFRLGRYTKDDLYKMVAIERSSIEQMERALSLGRGVLVITPHFGLYDLGCAWMGSQGWPLTTVTEVLKPRALYVWFTELRSRWGVQIVPAAKGQLTRRIGKILANGEVLALVADRDIGRRGIWADFFGERTTLPATPAVLMARKNITVLAGAAYREGSKLRVIFEPVDYVLSGDEQDDISACAQVVAIALERLIKNSPHQWHMFTTNWPSDEPHLPPRGRDDS